MQDVDSTTFNAATKHPVVVVDFWATWCQPCKPVTKLLEKLEKEYPNVRFVRVDADNNQHLAAKLGIQGLPTVLFYTNGQIVTGLESNKCNEMNIRMYLQDMAGKPTRK